jgi:DNA uptake protein ComE-like DNA-binding protein
MSPRLLRFLHFTRKERYGSLLLILICGAAFALPDVLRFFRPATRTDFGAFQAETAKFRAALAEQDAPAASAALFDFDPNTADRADFVRLGLSEKLAGTICNYRDKGGRFRAAADFQKIWGLSAADYARLEPFIKIQNAENQASASEKGDVAAPSAQLFPFDPNTAGEAELRQLGLPPWTVQSILNYRSKGGRFRQTADLSKIYNLSEADFARLAPYVSIAGQNAPPPPASVAAAAPPPAAARTLDINQAGLDAWMRLPGIGEKRARQLVHYRERLGGFVAVGQVAEVYSIPDSVFQAIRGRLSLDGSPIRQINLNRATVEELDAHPYFSPKQAQLIVRYREQHGPYDSAEGLQKIAAFNDKNWLEKVRPYLKVD